MSGKQQKSVSSKKTKKSEAEKSESVKNVDKNESTEFRHEFTDEAWEFMMDCDDVDLGDLW